MRVAVFSSKNFERECFDAANADHMHLLTYFDAHLRAETARLAHGYPAVCVFVSDQVDAPTLAILKEGGTQVIVLRSAGYNHVDLPAAKKLGLKVLRVPSYSPHAIAEHTLCLILALNRKIYKAYNRVRDGNFSLDGLMGFDLYGKTAGVVGTGKIGALVAKLLQAFGCKVLAADPFPNPELSKMSIEYVPLPNLLVDSDIVSLHCPLTTETKHLINHKTIALMKKGVMLINTGRGALIQTEDLIEGLKTKKIGFVGLDVYEEENELFFEDLSSSIITDDVFSRLLTFPNVLITGHQAFFTKEALHNIVDTTLQNIGAFEAGKELVNQI